MSCIIWISSQIIVSSSLAPEATHCLVNTFVIFWTMILKLFLEILLYILNSKITLLFKRNLFKKPSNQQSTTHKHHTNVQNFKIMWFRVTWCQSAGNKEIMHVVLLIFRARLCFLVNMAQIRYKTAFQSVYCVLQSVKERNQPMPCFFIPFVF